MVSLSRLRHVIDSLELGNIVPLLWSRCKWRQGGPGRPPHPPQGMLMAFAVMLAKEFTYRDMEDFLARVGPRFEPIFRDLVLQLAKRGVIRVGTAVPVST